MIERVEPELDGGRHAIKRVVGDVVAVEADIFCDGHDKIAAAIKYRAQDEPDWREAPMRARSTTTAGAASSRSPATPATSTRSRPGATCSRAGAAR